MLGRLLFRQRSFTLPNLIAGETLMPEFLSSGNPELAIEGIASEMNHWLNEPQQLLNNQRQLGQLAARFAQPGASDRTAELVLEYSAHPKQTSQNPSRLAA
jgi:lipid A disaccharide synthetase